MVSTENKRRRCTAKKADGCDCKGWAVEGTDPPRCYHHREENKKAIRAAAKKGGSVPRRPDLPMVDAFTPTETRKLLAGLITGLIDGRFTENTARAIAYIVSIDGRIAELQEMESRLSALETKEAVK